MSSDSDDDVLLMASSILIKKRRREKRKLWVNPYLRHRASKGRYATDFQDMRTTEFTFRENFHMTPAQYDQLLKLLTPRLTPKKTTRPDSISPNEKLAITLEFLASGSFQRHIASCYRVSKSTVAGIIESTCESIYEVLSQKFPVPKSQFDWTTSANQFNSMWQFPNCLGAIDGKHCAIKCPQNAGSLFYNYKGFHSIVLMAVADSHSRFTYFDVGAYGSEGDSSVFSSCQFGKALASGRLNLPKDQIVHGKLTPFAFLGDDAFPLHKNILKPYKPTKSKPKLDKSERMFNYRLSRARRCVENAFGILCARWQCLARTMFTLPEKAQKIIAACCSLHNWLMRDKQCYCPAGFTDTYDNDGNLVLGSFRQLLPPNSLFHSCLAQPNSAGRPPTDPIKQRDHLKVFFNSVEGGLEWQNKSIFIE